MKNSVMAAKNLKVKKLGIKAAKESWAIKVIDESHDFNMPSMTVGYYWNLQAPAYSWSVATYYEYKVSCKKGLVDFKSAKPIAVGSTIKSKKYGRCIVVLRKDGDVWKAK